MYKVKTKFQDLSAQSCQADSGVKSSTTTMENVTGGISIALSFLGKLNPLADSLAVFSYVLHLRNLVVDQEERPKTKVDWIEETLLLLLAIISLMSLILWLIPCGLTLPLIMAKMATILSFTLFSAAWQPKLPR